MQRCKWLGLSLCFLLAGISGKAIADTTDVVLTGVAVTALVVDWGQTRYISKNPRYHENNPILGKHPSTVKVDAYFLAAIAGTLYISYKIPDKYRKMFLGGVIATEAAFIISNNRIGIGISF